MSDFLFVDESDDESVGRNTDNIRSWKLMIIDDEAEIHSVTRLVLDGVEIDGYQLEFLSAYSASQARQLFEEHDDIAIALVDVVMETEHAGLELVRWIRDDLKNHATRLILRTGQPGQAPEESVIKNYDINDYKSKTELTATKLKTITYSAVRSYRDILAIEQHRLGLQKVIEATSTVLKSRTLPHFGSAVLGQLLDLLELDSSALYLSTMTEDLLHHQSFNVLAASGNMVESQYSLDDTSIPPEVRKLLYQAIEEKRSLINERSFVGYYPTDNRSISLLYVEHSKPLTEIEMHLLSVFAANIALTFENLVSKENILETQKELIFIISDSIEQRSKETGYHVKRVALICEALAEKVGLEKELVDVIRYAAPLHDLGKIAIPEEILHKPGKLDPQEWSVMKTHAQVGHDLLASSHRIIAKLGAEIAWTHHERWDGEGYPRGLKGEGIPMIGRIMAIADVFDALGSKRSYKEAWSNDRIRQLIVDERGGHFDPDLVDILLRDFDEFCAIREINPDC
jgi:response regulator RpfG family c-di-GMP phosphodiesterase